MAVKDLILSHIKKSKLIKNYDEVDVPDAFVKKVEEAEQNDVQVAMSAMEKRKMLGKVAVHAMVTNPQHCGQRDVKPYVFTLKDEHVQDLKDYEGEIIYGFGADVDHLILLGMILHPMYKNTNSGLHHSLDNQFYNDNIKVIKISKQIEKHFKNNGQFRHVSDFFQKTEDIDG